MNFIKQKSIKLKTLVLTVAAILFQAATAILADLRPVSMPSVFANGPGSYAVDNNFYTASHTAGTEVPWINIKLAELAIVRSLLIIMRIDCCFNRIGMTSIYIGNNSDPSLNPECKTNID